MTALQDWRRLSGQPEPILTSFYIQIILCDRHMNEPYTVFECLVVQAEITVV